MKKRNAFTLMELLGTIIILGILISLAVISYTTYLNSTKLKAFKIEETNFIDATKGAYADCLSNNTKNEFCNYHKQLENKYEYELVYLKELINDSYIDEIKNPYDTNKFCNSEKSYVYVSRKNTAQNNNSDIVYKTCLICGDRKSEDCLEEDLDYSTFDTTCTAYYDAIGGPIYDGNWTDHNVYLSFGASGNYRYGIDDFEYTVNNSNSNRIDANSSNTATLVLNKTNGQQEYKVQAFDGMNGKGTLVSCGASIKIDKETINSVSITGKTGSGKEVSSNEWVAEQVTLTANVNPTTSTSGYLYQWYLNGNKYGEQTSVNNLVVSEKGTYKVEVTNKVGKIVKTSSDFIAKVDIKTPICSLKVISGTLGSNNWYTSNVTLDWDIKDGTGSNIIQSSINNQTITTDGITTATGMVTDEAGNIGTCSIEIKLDKTTPTIAEKSSSNYITTSTGANITSYYTVSYGVSGGSTVCQLGATTITNTNQLALGVNTLTCTATGTNGETNSVNITFKHQYAATAYCSGGRTLSNGNCIYYYSSNESQCGCSSYKSCDACGVASYKECQNEAACGCGQYRCTLYKKCTKCTCSTWSSITYNCDQQLFTRDCNSALSGGTGTASFSTGRYSGCGTETVYGSECNNASSKVCNSINRCRAEVCGVESYNSCPSCGCAQASSCTKTENQYRYYQCDSTGNNGTNGTLSGTTCSF